ncbi:hypothetical protein A2U01_0048302 [Trifolium medium]|uniref:Ubiquitin-like domain-containing protein n=1 Tax=Trifolium medium TaxID=97028 RepID=A0A392QTC9_9FABA|nr:hypothetical protein [Trifolium medium]
MDYILVFKVKKAPTAIGTVKVVCMFGDLMEIHVEVEAKGTIHDLKVQMQKVLDIIGLGNRDTHVTQKGNILSDDKMIQTLESHTINATFV